MEFNEKLQMMRKQRGLTQEELANSLYVSRTAVSKWESGRGYPNIESLKALAEFFSVTVDDLLSSGEVLTIAEEDQQQTKQHFCNAVFGLLDLGTVLFLFLPFFRQTNGKTVHAVSLLFLKEIMLYLKIAYWSVIISLIVTGLLTLALQKCRIVPWERIKFGTSLAFNGVGVILFIVSPQPYAAALLFILLVIKLLMLRKL